MTVNDYISYFENLADKSIKINHTIGESKKGFFYIEWEELLSKLPSGIQINANGGNTIMYAIVPNYGYGGNEANFLKDYEGGYIILQKVSQVNDMPKVLEALTNVEAIVDEINLRIMKDSIDGSTLFTSEMTGNEFRISPVLRQHDNYYGFTCQFDFQSFKGVCIDGNNWSDLPNNTVNIIE